MRNLKKILALVMALAMSLSLVTIANASDFTDSDDITYEEAVDVMSAIGVIEGFEDGSFDPNGTLTREQAAKLVTYMLLGDNADRLGIESSTFNDVAVTRWSAPAIEYCVSLGIIDGAGDGNFYPAGQLTGYAFAKILLTALGYSSEKEGLTGTSWSVNVAALAMEVGLHDGLENGISSAVLTREEAAQMALNAIKAPLVAYENDTTVTVNGVPVSIGGGEAYYVTTTLAREQRIGKDTLSNTNQSVYTVEFGERYFPKLEMDEDTDPFGRPSYTWVYNGEDLGTYIDTDLLVAEYTDSVSAGDIYNDIGRTAMDEYSIVITVDGIEQPLSDINQIARNSRATLNDSGTGVLTQVFVDQDDEEVTVSLINTYLAQAEADYNERTEIASFHIWGVNRNSDGEYVKNTAQQVSGVRVSNEDVYVADIVDEQFVLVTVAQGAIQTVEDVEIVSDVTISAFSLNNYITADGERYDYAETAMYDDAVLDDYDANNLKEQTYNVYLDAYDNLIGLDIVEVASNYVFITGIEAPETSYITNPTRKANAIFLDGQSQVIDVKAADGTTLPVGTGSYGYNTWFSYSYSESSNVYTLTLIDDNQAGNKVFQGVVGDDGATTHTIDYAHTSLPIAATLGNRSQRVYGNNDSIYLTAEVGLVRDSGAGVDRTVITGASNVVTGVRNASITTYSENSRQEVSDAGGTIGTDYQIAEAAYVLSRSNGYIIGAVVVGSDAAISRNIVFASSSSPSLEGYDSETGMWTWERKVILDGEETTLRETSDVSTGGLTELSSTNMDQYKWYLVSYNADGFVTNAEEIDSTPPAVNLAYVDDFTLGAIQAAIDTAGIDTVIYEDDFRNRTVNGLPTLIEQTLYMDTTDANGFFMIDDVKVVLIQSNNGRITTEYSEGPSAVEAAIASLNPDSNNRYTYTVNALIEDGAAQVVIIEDTTNGGAPTGDHTGGGDYSIDSIRLGTTNIAVIVHQGDTAIPDGTEATVTLQIFTDAGWDNVDTFTLEADNNEGRLWLQGAYSLVDPGERWRVVVEIGDDTLTSNTQTK